MKSRRSTWIVVLVVLALVAMLVAAYAAEGDRRQPRTKVEKIKGGKIFPQVMVNKATTASGQTSEERRAKAQKPDKKPPQAPKELTVKQRLEKLEKLPGGREALERAKALGFDRGKAEESRSGSLWDDASGLLGSLSPLGAGKAHAAATMVLLSPKAPGGMLSSARMYLFAVNMDPSWASLYIACTENMVYMHHFYDPYVYCEVLVKTEGWYTIDSRSYADTDDTQLSLWHHGRIWGRAGWEQVGVYPGSNEWIYTEALMYLPEGWHKFKVMWDYGWGWFNRFTMQLVDDSTAHNR
jgi:hypothetical protein